MKCMLTYVYLCGGRPVGAESFLCFYLVCPVIELMSSDLVTSALTSLLSHLLAPQDVFWRVEGVDM